MKSEQLNMAFLTDFYEFFARLMIASKENMKSIAADPYVVKFFYLTELKNKVAMALEAKTERF